VSVIQKQITSIRNKEELPDQLQKRVKKLAIIIIVGYHCARGKETTMKTET
jgi:hypothetical protein